MIFNHIRTQDGRQRTLHNIITNRIALLACGHLCKLSASDFANIGIQYHLQYNLPEYNSNF